CHEPTGDKGHKFSLTAEGGDLCTECHDEFSGKVQHSPASEGQCTVCHDPHGSEAEKLLTQAKVSDVCLECHESVTEDLPYLHGPVAAGACTACHDAHASDHPALLFAEGRDLCLKCHTAMRDRIAAKPHKHNPATEDCTACHASHGADNQMNLTTAPPELCLDCHDTVAEAMDDASVTHDALTTGKSCAGCHDAHAADVEHILLKESMDLCLSCHSKELAADGRRVIDIGRLLKDNPEHHGPIRDKDCTSCHGDVHGSERFRLLSQQYPAEFYVAYDEARYALCFECHEAEAFESAETDDLTDFRNGEVNLHYLHVNRTVKGRTCRACHSAHASSGPKHVPESVPFGAWQIPINYRQTPSGGSCQPGCHRSYRYDRDSPVANLASRTAS
ncbi:MAG: cytochrome c3 family protein, partial [Planctomycetota bacterium]